ncbi:MAG TPA: N-acyl homoserine lactonase family protein [Smithellaceae bacterium]|nr:N-acyl homoserine lactonase family protein [Smithellaceae bacterium]HRY38874.1 N-acyl homoserine lactonase family protein [Smithellaceae bacterium]
MASSVKIHLLQCGSVRVDRSLPFREKTIHPAPFTGVFRRKTCQVWLPMFSYLIEHPKGLILMDTGWHTDVRVNQIKHLGMIHYLINKADLPAGQAIHEQLEQRGIKVSDLDFVVLSHLHSDHASGLKLVRSAKKILVSEPEWICANGKEKIRYVPSMWEGVKVETYRFSPSEYGPQKSSFDLFRDGTVQFVHTPGHTRGLACTLIQSKNKYVLLFFDAGYARKSWEKMIPPGTAVDKEQAWEALGWVRKMSQPEGCIASLASHDTGVQPQTIEL